MGLFSFRKPPARVNSSGSVPHTADLLYPAVLPAFSEIAAGEHRDPRAVFYTIRFMDPQRSRPFTPDVLDASDFGSKAEVRRVLVRRGFVQNADAGQTLSVLYTKDAMKELLRKRSLSVGGTKEQQAARLLADGFRVSASRRPSGYPPPGPPEQFRASAPGWPLRQLKQGPEVRYPRPWHQR